MRTLAIDFGEKRIGLAISDAGGKLATPLRVIEASSSNQITEIARSEGVEQLIIGLPLNMDGSVGPGAKKVVRWGEELAKATGLEVLYVDERLSSFEADQTLNDRRSAGENLTRKKKKLRRDAIAAAGFLRAYLLGQSALSAAEIKKHF